MKKNIEAYQKCLIPTHFKFIIKQLGLTCLNLKSNNKVILLLPFTSSFIKLEIIFPSIIHSEFSSGSIIKNDEECDNYPDFVIMYGKNDCSPNTLQLNDIINHWKFDDSNCLQTIFKLVKEKISNYNINCLDNLAKSKSGTLGVSQKYFFIQRIHNYVLNKQTNYINEPICYLHFDEESDDNNTIISTIGYSLDFQIMSRNSEITYPLVLIKINNEKINLCVKLPNYLEGILALLVCDNETSTQNLEYNIDSFEEKVYELLRLRNTRENVFKWVFSMSKNNF